MVKFIDIQKFMAKIFSACKVQFVLFGLAKFKSRHPKNFLFRQQWGRAIEHFCTTKNFFHAM